MPKLTVLMPVYNSERFLVDAIDSILNQTFTDFEFLIIDDCSTDNSPTIVSLYTDARIRFYRNEKNIGISQTLNKGIKLSACEWIARMDSDDISYPERLQKQYEFLLSHPDGALFSCSVQVTTEDGKLLRQDIFHPNFYYYNLIFICWIYHPTVLYNKKAVEDVDMYTVPYAEDYDLFWKLSRNYKIYHLPEVLLSYRVTNQSLYGVLKKREYEQAEKEQVIRNIRYYTHERFSVKTNHLECLRHNFLPLLQENKIESVVECVRQLNFINRMILLKENVNRDPESIIQAAFYKREFILAYYVRHLSRGKSLWLLIRTGSWQFLFGVFKRMLWNKFKSY